MNINEAAKLLLQRRRHRSWLTAVAVGGLDDQEVIFVYTKYAVKTKELETLKAEGWHGYDVRIERVGKASAVA
jgi:hypothetical protein